MTRDELLEQKTELEEQLAIVNNTIKNVLGRTNEKYLYSNQEGTHQAQTHDITKLREQRQYIVDEIANIERQLGCTTIFTQFKS